MSGVGEAACKKSCADDEDDRDRDLDRDEAGAQSDFQAAIKVDPKFAAAHYYLGLSFLETRKPNSGIASLERAALLGGDIAKAAKAKLKVLTKK